MRLPTKRQLALLLTLVLAGSASLSAQITDRARLVAALDSAARAHVAHAAVPGVSVAVVRGADTLLLRGYGSVDLEWDVPTPADGRPSYEIGSMTKQFTAAAVMKLVEQGKLDLSADMTTYLPDYDTRGHHVTVRRLLDHTSGIKGYTEMPVFGEIMDRELPRDSLVTLIEKEPFDFEPGTAQIYNNSAFFLLGLIIEKVSGTSYADFVKDQLFTPAGMDHSYYCSESAIRKDRAHGYDATRDGGLRHKAYLNQIWPFAAGSLCSTVGDLVRWNQALHHGRVVSAPSYRAMITPETLLDGTPIRYGMGLVVDDTGGRRLITHGGGINGYTSDGRYYPDDDLTVIVLQNSTGAPGPAALSSALADLVLGPAPVPPATPYAGDLDALVGTYEGPARGRPLTLKVTREGDQLVFEAQRADAEPLRPAHWWDETWGRGMLRLTFVREGGRASALLYDTGGGHYVLKRTGG
ncbi:MAG: serine hydrolase [Gemmatimonadota bacterium]|jgi:CubicO group peptidase (beta-lactamase class C family)